LANKTKAKWLIDLHGAAKVNNRLAENQLVDLGVGNNNDYLPSSELDKLRALIEQYLGNEATDRKDKQGFKASNPNRIAAFAHKTLSISSVQIEMKPQVRIPLRRVDSSVFTKSLEEGGGQFSASPQKVLGMLQALVDFIEYLKFK
jgi:hypothetical protein